MSNTSVVTPYQESDSSNRSTGEILGDLVSWLSDSDEDRRNDRRAEEVRAREVASDLARRKESAASSIVSADLHLPDATSLLRSIPRAGYTLVQKLPRPQADFHILQSNHGDRVVIEQRRGGGVRLYSSGSRAPISKIVRQHTLDRALDHLRSSGMQVASKTLPNGEVQVVARGGSSAAGELHAQIRRDGTSILDVVGVRGPQCMEIVHGFAEATGATVEQTAKKEDYYALPGTLRREKVRTS